MCNLRVSFSEKTDVKEVSRVDADLVAELFYSEKDYERFQDDERRRWERAIAKKLKKMDLQRQEVETEEKRQRLEVFDALQAASRFCPAPSPLPSATPHRAATAA